MNLILLQKWYPLVSILKNDRKKYYRALEKADKGEQLVLLSKLAKTNPYSEKYLNLLVRSGKLEAHKEGRNWVSSQKALDDYLANRERKRKVK